MARAADEMAFETRVQEFKDCVKRKGEQLILVVIPEKIILLDSILGSLEEHSKNVFERSNNIASVNHHDDEPPSKKSKKEDNHVEETVVSLEKSTVGVVCNQKLMALIQTMKPHIKGLVEDANILKMSLTLMIPKMEDGNNFGVSVQEDVLNEIISAEREGLAFYDRIARYFCSRGKIMSKLEKYPQIDDYRHAVEELDEKEHMSMMFILREIRNWYSTLHDIVVKNWDKVREPRSENSESMY